MRKITIILLVLVVAASGCVSNNSDQTINSENNNTQQNTNTENDDESILGKDPVTKYTSGNESFRMTVEVNNETETYDFSIEQRENVTGDEYFSRYDAANFSASFMCGFAQQVAYNYSEFSENKDSSGLESSNSLSEGLEGSETNSEDTLPQWVFEQFEAEEVSYILTDNETSEQIATCEPTKDNLNIDIDIEKDSENSEGLS